MNIKEIIEKSKINTPAHLIDLNQIRENFKNINTIRKSTGAKFFLALKGFSNDEIIERFIDNLDGLSSSGLFEARLGKELESKVSTFTPTYTDENIKEICKNSEYIVFNSLYQYKKYFKEARKENCSIGIRINPEYTELPDHFGSNTCKKDSHLGIKKENMPSMDEFCEEKIEGIHLHTMCEQYADTLERTIDFLISNYNEYLKRIKWINLGGGQLFGDSNYNCQKAIKSISKLKKIYNIQVILEPCEGIMLNSGYYVTKVIDLLKNNMFNGITFPNLYIIDNNQTKLIKKYDFECFKNII